jgi:hypothetical protein
MDYQERKTKILAAAHSFTVELESLGVKFATVVYDETLQDGGGLRIYSLGNVPLELQDWLLNQYVEVRRNSEIVDMVHVSSDPNRLPA